MIGIHVGIVLVTIGFAIWKRRSFGWRVCCTVLLYLWFLNLLAGMFWTRRHVPLPDKGRMMEQVEYSVAWNDGVLQMNKRFTDVWPPIICIYTTGLLALALIPRGNKKVDKESQQPAAD